MRFTRSEHGYARLACAAGGAVALFVSQAISAQDQGGLEEVVVTAQRREQNVQDVPIAITAFTGEMLQSRGLNDIHALSNITPNVNLDSGAPFSGDSSVLSASIRGIGQDDFAFNLDPGVGVYLDGVYLARTIGANQNLLDVDRIEILKGPQGTLFGRNTIGGAISIVTHIPGAERRVIATASTGSFNRRDLAFTADMPISDKLLTSISVSSQERDGYQKVIPYPSNSLIGSTPFVVDQQTAFPKAGYETSNANGGQDLKVIRGKALWHASDDVDVTLAGDWARQDQSAFPTTVVGVSTPALSEGARATLPGPTFGFMGGLYNYCIGTPAAELNTPTNFGGIFGTQVGGMCGPRGQGLNLAAGGAALGGAGYVGGPGGNSLLSNQPRIFWNFANTQTGDIDKTYATGPSFAKYNSAGTSVTVDVKLPEDLTFKSITGWRYIDWHVGVDLDGTPETIQEVSDHQYQHQISQEFQLAGKAFDNKLDWVTGLYYFKEAGYVHDYVPFGGGLFIYDVANDVDTESYAVFTHADYKITDKFGLTVGARYSKDDKKFEGGQADLDGYSYKSAGCFTAAGPDMACWNRFVSTPGSPGFGLAPFPDPTNPYRYFPPGEQSQKASIFTPTVGFQFHATDDVMLYTSYSKGFKAGGWTTRLSNPLANIDDAAFGPEKDETYELGAKSQLLNRHLQVNGAVFDSKYTGIQLNIQEAASPVLHNAGDARIKGAELEIEGVIDGGFSVLASASYIDAKYTSVFASAASQGITTANKLPKTPKTKFSVGPQYDLTLPNSGVLRFGADYTHTSDMFNDAPNSPLLHRPAVNNWNAAVHYLSPETRYELTLGGTNLSDERYIVVGSVNGAEGETVATYSRPREWYLTLRVNFD
ncbi:MAG: TonB-dependent receptor [Gammaproteobacteria bacterium]